MDNQSNKFSLKLPKPMSDYTYVELESEREEWTEEFGGPYQTIWLDIEKVVDLTKLGGQDWPDSPSEWCHGKCEYFIAAWDPCNEGSTGRLIHMPRIAINPYRRKKLGLLKTFINYFFKLVRSGGKKLNSEKYVVAFGNGRHRTEFFRSQGVRRMPFEVREYQVNLLMEQCG